MQAGKERAAAERLGGDGRRAGTATEEKPSGDGRKAKEGGMEEDGNDKRTDGDRRKTKRRRQKGRDG